MTKRNLCSIRLLGIIVAALFAITGCSANGDSESRIDPNSAASSLLEQVTFLDTLVKAEDGAAENYYRLDASVDDYAIYVSGSGATAEEIAVLQVAENAQLQNVEAIVNKRVDTLKLQFENYVPQEMVKLQSPVIVSRGNIVILVIADDSAQAQQAVDALFA